MGDITENLRSMIQGPFALENLTTTTSYAKQFQERGRNKPQKPNSYLRKAQKKEEAFQLESFSSEESEVNESSNIAI